MVRYKAQFPNDYEYLVIGKDGGLYAARTGMQHIKLTFLQKLFLLLW